MMLFLISALVTIDPLNKVPITLSSTDMNRLAFKNGRIASVYGTDLFSVEIDDKLGQVFLSVKPELSTPESLSMAFTTEDGMTQDLFVTFKEGRSKSVIFETKPEPSSLRRKAYQFFYQVLSGQTGQFVTQTNGVSQNYGWGELRFQKRVMSKEFSVEFFELRSKQPGCSYNLSHRFFLSPGVCGIWLSDIKLSHPKFVIVAKLRRRV